MENNNCDDFIQECYVFFERMNIKYRDIVEEDSPCIATKRVKRNLVPGFNDTDYNIQLSPVMEVSIKFNVFVMERTQKAIILEQNT